MGFVIDGLFAAGLVCTALWLLSLRGSAVKDSKMAQERELQAEEERARVEREARLQRPGEPLRCLSCNTTFLGPLSPTGCPNCHLSALVIAEADYRRGQENH